MMSLLGLAAAARQRLADCPAGDTTAQDAILSLLTDVVAQSSHIEIAHALLGIESD